MYNSTAKFRFNEWPPSAHFASINWDFTLNRDFLMWNLILVTRLFTLMISVMSSLHRISACLSSSLRIPRWPTDFFSKWILYTMYIIKGSYRWRWYMHGYTNYARLDFILFPLNRAAYSKHVSSFNVRRRFIARGKKKKETYNGDPLFSSSSLSLNSEYRRTSRNFILYPNSIPRNEMARQKEHIYFSLLC